MEMARAAYFQQASIAIALLFRRARLARRSSHPPNEERKLKEKWLHQKA